MIIAISCVIAIAVIAFILGVLPKDLPVPEPESPFAHLDERKAAIYENLRDLQFEYRVSKLSDEDYQNTKKDLQKELAGVLAEMDKLKITPGMNGPVPPNVAAKPAPDSRAVPKGRTAREAKLGFTCDACGTTFDKELKFCGECGNPMTLAK